MRIVGFLVFCLVVLGARAQYYDSTEIASIHLNRTAAEGNFYLDTIREQYYIGLTTGEIVRLGINRTWLLNGNDSIASANYMGSRNDAIVNFKSNNTTALSVGRRITQGLYDGGSTGLFPYNDSNAVVSYLQGIDGVSSLEFEADGAEFYKPIFFTDTLGNFKMRGSSATTDFFELGSAGTVDNEGSLEFIIGDDGDEPMTFSKYNYTTEEYIEMVRMQGVGLDSTVRVGIDVKGEIPTSTLQVQGSFATAIEQTTTAITLGETNHTVILDNNSAITLPDADTAIGRQYTIKKTNEGLSTISDYIDDKGVVRSNIGRGTFTLVSDGTQWQLLFSQSTNVYSGTFVIGTSTVTIDINDLPFKPSRIEFVAYANVDNVTLSSDNGVGNNNSGINNSFGYMTGFAQNYNGTITQQVICGGGSGNSINDISRYAAINRCVGVRYGNQNGDNIGLTTASISSFDNDGFTLAVNDNDDALIVMYTAYR